MGDVALWSFRTNSRCIALWCFLNYLIFNLTKRVKDKKTLVRECDYHTHSITKSLQDSSHLVLTKKVLFQGSNFLLQSTNETSNLKKKSFLVRFEVYRYFSASINLLQLRSEVKWSCSQSKVLQSSRPTEISFSPKTRGYVTMKLKSLHHVEPPLS